MLRLPQCARFVDKTLENYLYCGLIHVSLPLAKIILVQRRPMDACWAMYKAHFQGKFAFSYDQTEVAEYYLAYRRLAQHWTATLPPGVLLDINYEDIVSDQETASRRMIAFLGLPWDDDVLCFTRARRRRRPRARSRCDARSMHHRSANGSIMPSASRQCARGSRAISPKPSSRDRSIDQGSISTSGLSTACGTSTDRFVFYFRDGFSERKTEQTRK